VGCPTGFLDTEKPYGNSLLQQRISPRITTKFSLRDFSMNHNPVSEIYRDKGHGPLTFGFDIGIASVGWAVLSETRIVDLGVRCFDAAEDPKEKISLNQARRAARTSRNRHTQRRSRLRRLSQLFVAVGLINADSTKALFAESHISGIALKDIWELRAEALTRILNGSELARVLHHLVKWRGYGSLRDAKDRAETDAERNSDNQSSESAPQIGLDVETSSDNTNNTKKKLSFSAALDKTSDLMGRLLSKHLTVGNLVNTLSDSGYLPCTDEREAANLYGKAKRNHDDGYERSHLRKYLRQEIVTIFARQRLHGSSNADRELPANAAGIEKLTVGTEKFQVDRTFEQQVLALFDEQYPPIVAAQLEQLVGKCALEKNEPRAPKESYSAERSRWLQNLNRLRVRVQGDPRGERFLDATEHVALVNLPYLKTDVTYADLRDALCESAGWSRDWRIASFSPLSYRSVATEQSDQISVQQPNGEKLKLIDVVVAHLPKTDRKGRTKAKTEFKEWLQMQGTKGLLTFESLRAYLKLPDDHFFSMLRRKRNVILPDAETEEKLPLSGYLEEPIRQGFFIKTRTPIDKTSRNLPGPAMAMLKKWSAATDQKTLADLRNSVDTQNWPVGAWQFIIEEKLLVEPTMANESSTTLELAFTDAQTIEKDTRFERLRGWHKLKKALELTDPALWMELQAAWTTPLTDSGLEARNRIDSIFDALALCFTDTEVETALERLQPALAKHTVTALRDIVSSGFAHLSYLALHTIQPKLEDREIYSEACRLSPKGYDHSGSRTRRKAKVFLPPLDSFLFKRISVKTNEVKKKSLPDGTQIDVVERRYKDLANPVVARSFNQARNVLNALIQEYGSPAHISIELARDLSKPGELRKKIERENTDRAKLKEKNREAFALAYGKSNPSDALMRKVRMRNEQDCKCMYSGNDIDLDQMLKDEKYVEVDHILPKSRTNDNSLDNQVLVLSGENQRKGNRTPYEWKGKSDPVWWHHFKVTVLALPLMSDKKKSKLLLEALDEQEFTSSNLVDTRYATRLFASVIREGLIFHGGNRAQDESINPDDKGSVKMDRYMRARVRTPQGGITSMLRGLWGLSKHRDAGDLHHAIDACVIAAATPRLIQRLNEYNRFQEEIIITSNGTAVWRESADKALGEVLNEDELGTFVEKDFPQPFHPNMFHQEVMARLSRDARTYMTKRGEHKTYDFRNYTFDEREKIRPVTVSRLVQRYKLNNELHDSNPKALRQMHFSLDYLTPELLQLDRYPKQFSKQHRQLFESLSTVLAKHSGDAKIAFASGSIQIGAGKPIFAVQIPWLYLTDAEQNAYAKRVSLRVKDIKSAYKTIPLTKLTLDMLCEETLGRDIWRRDQLLIKALREELEEPSAKASVVFANGFPKPTSHKENERRKLQGITNFVPPIVKSLRVPDRNETGFIVRGGIVGQGAAISVRIEKNLETKQFEFTPKYAAKDVYQLPRQNSTSTPIAKMHIELLSNSFVAIDHPNTIYCFAETRRRLDQTGRVLIDIEPLFPDKIFVGYYNNYAPSNGQTVLRLHDNSYFFLLADGGDISLTQQVLTERKKINTRKNSKTPSIDLTEYVLLADVDLPRPRTFARTKEISRQIFDAKSIDRLTISNLGRWNFNSRQ
jgi:CRISPR/Cas system Type II protein with McrA/HNH and RuvC-like nuclease domain